MISLDSFSTPIIGGLLVRVTALLAVAWLAERVVSRGSASMRHALWVAAFAGVLVLPLAARFVPPLELPLLPATAQERVSGPAPCSQTCSPAETAERPPRTAPSTRPCDRCPETAILCRHLNIVKPLLLNLDETMI